MRRKNREIESMQEKLALLAKCRVCRLAVADADQPYVVPLNYGYEYAEGVLTLYFHGAAEGMKIDILKKNPRACFEIDGEGALVDGGDRACAYSYAYESLIGFGSVTFVEDPKEKARGLNILMKHMSGRDGFAYSESDLARVCVYKITATSFTGKRRA
ncbi:MAG: pyridoxamine 5'-phosphate oxidase family protein [Spirochaetia bacterium]|jgi:nitroimidazol reductase NimA-like FMN-containing flavoprotein (pyridoxamine 5'-phosphate oxidase superfamily)|nr:pyridoxamine 5'-phosphate oxidase family protein [Spirochaetia bacterium]